MTIRIFLLNLALAMAYTASGWLALKAAIPPDYVSIVFIPAGLALGAVLTGGRALLPGVWLGSMGVQWLAHLQSGAPLAVGPLLLIPLAATLQAHVTAQLLKRTPGYPSPLDSPQQVLKAFFLVAPLGTTVCASIAVPVLGLSGVIPADALWTSWLTWWLGDSLGVVLTLPLMLVFFGSPGPAWRSRVGTVATPTAVAMVLIAVMHHELNTSNLNVLRREFEKMGHDTAQALQRRLDAQSDALEAVGTLMAMAGTRVDQRGFDAVTQPWLGRYPGIQNFGWSPWVPHEERRRYEATHWPIQGRNAAGQTYPADAANHYLPITWVSPWAGNRAVLGLDVSVLPTTARTVAATRQSRQTETTPAFRLVQESGDQRGVVMYRAVFEQQPGGERFKGVVSAVYRMGDVLTSALGTLQTDLISLCLEDVQGAEGNRRLAGPPGCEETHSLRDWRLQEPITVAGREWRLHVGTTPAFWAQSHSWTARLTTIVGLVAISILGAFLIVITGQRRRTEQLVAERTNELAVLAHFDPLTGTANRTLWMQEAEQALSAAQLQGKQMAVIFLDLDRFKQINDSLGHSQGDLLLKTVAERIRSCLRSRDLVARFGGDEFVLLMPWLKGREGAAVVSEKVSRALAEPVRLGNQHITVTASMGVAMFPDDGQSVEALLRHADTAMYAVKGQGRNHWRFFSPEMHEHVSQRVQLESGLRRALQGDGPPELRLEFQPLINAQSGRAEGWEALTRWHHPELGAVPPSLFIPVAEESGLIEGLGQWALREACQHIHAWESAPDSPFRPGMMVAVNVSALEFKRPGFVDHLRQTLLEFAIHPGRLELEITESLLIDSGQDLSDQFQALTQLGISFSLDDFGTGYSSLGYIKRLPLSKLKIDKSFIQDVPGDPDDETIIRATLSMAHDLGLRVVAEGVETTAQRDLLHSLHCDLYQGWLFSRPMPADQVLPWLRAQRPHPAH